LQKSKKEIIDEVIDKIILEEQNLIASKEPCLLFFFIGNFILDSADQNTFRAKRDSVPQERMCKLRSYRDYKSRFAFLKGFN
jgi:hypothetical protein